MNRTRPFLTVLLTVLLSLASYGESRKVHILSMNDMHAAIEAFPQLAAIVDSLRALDPGLLVLSAGDNRTGNPVNDLYEIPAYPMVALMNQVGFHATALGNHEFDSHQDGLARLIGLSTFRYLCANIHPDESLGINTVPYQVFDVGGLKIGIIGVVQLGTHGIPDTHPNNVTGISFTSPEEEIAKYEWLSKECDATILLSHIGYDGDVVVSKAFPWLDLIVGGHSHTQIKGGEMHNGVLITQDANKLKKVTYITLTIEDGKVTEKTAENIDVASFPRKNKIVENMVEFFKNNPEFYRVLAQADTPFSTYDELGCLMCDAMVAETGADVAFVNAGGIRYEEHPAGDFTVDDVLRLDPFGNTAVEFELTGEELRQMLMACHQADDNQFPCVAGVKCKLKTVGGDARKLKDVALFTLDGKKLNLKKSYRVVTNSYAAVVSDSPKKDPGRDLNRQTSDMIMRYLEKQGHVSYQGVSRVEKE